MRRHSIVKSLTVVAALSTCAVAAPTAFARTDIPLKPDTSKAVIVAQQPRATSNDLRSPDAIAAAAVRVRAPAPRPRSSS
jgi:hypothetical protein